MSTSTIDPRIRARRIAVQRDEGRKRLRRLSVGAGVVATAAGLWGITLTPLLDIDHIVVEGATSTGPGPVADVLGIRRGDALLTAGIGRAAEHVAALPWVATVDVSRRWPGTIRVRVVERTPAAVAPVAGGGWVLLDAGGRQLAVVPQPPAGLLRIQLPPVAAEPGAVLDAGGSVLALAASRPDALRDRLVALRPAAGGAVEGVVRLGDGRQATVVFGRPTQTDAKWLALLTVLDGADPDRLVRIDVRVPSAPALTRR